jgi:urease accessory protein
LRALFPRPAPGEPLTTCVTNTAGGLVAGDRLTVSVSLTDGARALVMAQAAEKVYRSGTKAEARVSVHLSAGPGCWLEWLPRETIVFDHARLRRETTLDLDPGAAVLAGEIIVLGRRAHGETLSSGLIRDAWRVRIGGRLAWADALHMEGDITRHRLAAAGLDGAEALATIIAHLPDRGSGVGTLIDNLRARLDDHQSVRTGTTCVNRLLICRILSRDAALMRAAFVDAWALLRRAGGGWPETLPRLWHI